MKTIAEYGRYLISLVMLSVGLLGLYLAFDHGGAWVWLGLTGFFGIALADFLVGRDTSRRVTTHPFFNDLVLYLPLPLMVGLWLLLAQHIGRGDLSLVNQLGAVIVVGFLSALGGLPAAHELMHRKHPLEILYASLYQTVFGLPMNDLGHVHVHHPCVGTPEDCDTPVRGESVYRFVARSIVGQTRDALRIESERLEKLGLPRWHPRGRFLWAALTLAAWVGAFLWIAGPMGLIWLPLTWTFCFLILGGFNYTQHYGLVRKIGAPLRPDHSWNHLNTFSRAVSFEISNHAEHHLDPDKHYQYLKPYPEAPQMPSIVGCFLASFIPPLWERKIAMPRLRHWDNHFANADERKLASEANARAGWPQWLEARDQAMATAA